VYVRTALVEAVHRIGAEHTRFCSPVPDAKPGWFGLRLDVGRIDRAEFEG
jgi:hypothetical protein